MVALFVLVLPPPTRPRISAVVRERGRNNGESVGDRKVKPRGCEFRPEVEYFQRANLLESSRLGALLYPEETLKQLDMSARGRLQREVRT
jgi:hypothetical protein